MSRKALDVEVESPGGDISRLPLVALLGEEVRKVGGAGLGERLGKLNEALSPVRGVVDRHEEVPGFVRDKVGDEINVGGIPIPRLRASKQLARM